MHENRAVPGKHPPPRTHGQSRRTTARRIREPAWRVLLFVTVLAASSLLTTGFLHSVDEVSLLVAAANTVDEGRPHVNQIGYTLWTPRPGEAVTVLAPSGDTYTKKSPIIVAALAPLIALARLLPFLGEVQAALLLGPLLLAATATLLYALARILGYSRATGTVTALLFASCSAALPYTQTIFGEPAASAGLLLALWGVARSASPDGNTPVLPQALCGLGLAVAIAANSVYLLTAPIFGLALLAGKGRRALLRRAVRVLPWFGLPLALAGAGLVAYNLVRFGSWLETGYHLASGEEGFTTPLWWGLAGLTISPARGLLWYSPSAWLAVAGWRRFHRAHRTLSLVTLAIAGLHLVVFGTWWAWWGGYCWGPRFLIPLLPGLALAGLPLVNSLLGGPVAGKAALALVAAAGLAVQAAGVAVDLNVYERELSARFPVTAGRPLRYHHDPALVFDVARSPILQHWRQFSTGRPQIALLSGDEAEPRAADLLAAILAGQEPGDVVVSLVPELLFEVLSEPHLPPVHGLPFNLPSTDANALTLFRRALQEAERVWLVTWYGPGDPGNWYEQYLRSEWASVSEAVLDDLRLILLARPPGPGTPVETAVAFGAIELSAYRVQTAGDALFVELAWQAGGAIEQDYTTFVHVLDGDGRLVAQQDRPPLAGYAPTTGWPPGERVVDRFAFPLAEEQAAGARIAVGWYSWPSLERLPAQSKEGAGSGTAVLLSGEQCTLIE
jgi:hypothetical protein